MTYIFFSTYSLESSLASGSCATYSPSVDSTSNSRGSWHYVSSVRSDSARRQVLSFPVRVLRRLSSSSAPTTMAGKPPLLLVYSDIVGSLWANRFELDRSAGELRSVVYTECLQGLLPSQSSSAHLNIYYLVRSSTLWIVRNDRTRFRAMEWRTNRRARSGNACATVSTLVLPRRSVSPRSCLRS